MMAGIGKQCAVWLILLSWLYSSIGADTITTPKEYIINLDLPAEERWNQVVDDFRNDSSYLYKMISTYIPKPLIPLIEKIAARVDTYLPSPFAGEIRGIANRAGIPLGLVVSMNLVYDVSAFCTGIVAQDNQGKIWHARNLDYGFGDMLRNVTIQVHFQSEQKTVYSATTFAYYTGILTGQKPNVLTANINQRSESKNYLDILENILTAILYKNTVPTSFLLRQMMQSAPDFNTAVKHLSTTIIPAPVYYIVGGVNPGEGVVITRDRLGAVNTYYIDIPRGRWFCVETNFDRWSKPLSKDIRRLTAIKAMNATGQSDMNVPSLFNVISTKPVLNYGTVYSVVMSAGQPHLYQAWIRRLEENSTMK